MQTSRDVPLHWALAQSPDKTSSSALTCSGSLLRAGIRREPPDWPVLLGGHSPEENLEEGVRVMTAMTGATSPDIVLINSNLWRVLS